MLQNGAIRLSVLKVGYTRASERSSVAYFSRMRTAVALSAFFACSSRAGVSSRRRLLQDARRSKTDAPRATVGTAAKWDRPLRCASQRPTIVSCLFREGIPAKGMPPLPLDEAKLGNLLKFLSTIERKADPTVSIRSGL